MIRDEQAKTRVSQQPARHEARTGTSARGGVYTVFDGLRGLAALMVVSRHTGPWFGPLGFPESFLAVDLFFILSGFVVANAYGARLEGGGFFKEFCKIRLIRLYPLYFAGLIAAILLRLYMLDKDGDPWTMKMIVLSALGALFMLPGPAGLVTAGYRLNSPSWTLAPELLCNLIYAGLIRFLTLPVLIGIVAVCGLGLVPFVLGLHTLDLGYKGVGVLAIPFRMGFSFFLGVILHRLRSPDRKVAPLAALGVLAALLVILAYSPPLGLRPWYELFFCLIGFPLMILLASRVETTGALARALRWLGLISYAVYTLHEPVAQLIYEALKRFEIIDVWYFAPLSGFVLIIGLCLFAALADRLYDAPLRRALSRLYLRPGRN